MSLPTAGPRPGVLLGSRYELRERLAVGGMGEVWSALDRRLGRTVAAKVLRPELGGDDVFLARLRAEARNTAGLQHRNLAVLLDHGEGAGLGFLVMELVHGETLAAWLDREGPMPPAQLVAVLVQACHGLQAAHNSGIVHRDVKPANLMLGRDGEVKLTDFGISLAANQATMTSAGMVMGTAHYLAPEQATGQPASPAGDIYALGVLAFEALTGRRPYSGTTQVEVATAHIHDPVPPLPAQVPPPLAAVVRRMLAKAPEQRPASALRCAQELAAAMEVEGTAAPELTPAPSPPTPPPPPAPPPSAPPAATATRAQARTAVPRTPARPEGRAASRAPRSWRLPSWQEIAADRIWLHTMVVVVMIVLVLAATLAGIATLGRQDGVTTPDAAVEPQAGPAVAPVPSMIVRTIRG
ncbi:serine/threonine-protein kinase [Bogoriella caseilytica]|uniref:non-specific serine/threonine protein kinase n=1 Tax=Bogoriella caseilytica TaxID=56055 RepID=A0A3N2BCB4_9MICO|nr:serine/threonine-protein kinase [Bogoriella caseilytica]ROR72913.1 serine/threonine-protein kinase [Bogoriella caseilytica]